MNWKLTNFLLISALALTQFSAQAQKDAALWLNCRQPLLSCFSTLGR